MPTAHEGRLQFCDLVEPSRFSEPGKPFWSATIMIDKHEGAEWIEQFKEEILAAARDKFGASTTWKSLSVPLSDGDEEEYESSHGHWIVKFKSKQKPPLLVGQDRNPIAANHVYPGCYVRVAYSLYVYDYSGKGVGCGLHAIQKAKDGVPFGATVTMENIDQFFDVIEPADLSDSLLD